MDAAFEGEVLFELDGAHATRKIDGSCCEGLREEGGCLKPLLSGEGAVGIMLREVVKGDYEFVGEGGIAITVSGEAILASGIVYIKEGDAIYGVREAVVVGDGVRLCEEVRDEVRRKGRKSEIPHVVDSDDGEVGGMGDVCVEVCDEGSTVYVLNKLYVDDQKLRSRELSPGGIPR